MSDSSQPEAKKQECDEYFNGLLIPKIGSKWIEKDSVQINPHTVTDIWHLTTKTRHVQIEGDATKDARQVEIRVHFDGDPPAIYWDMKLEQFLVYWEPAPMTSTDITTDTI